MHSSLIGGVCLPVDPSLVRMIHRPLFLFVSFRSGYYVDSRRITVGDLDMVGNATRVRCEKYSRESSCTRSTEAQALPVSKCPARQSPIQTSTLSVLPISIDKAEDERHQPLSPRTLQENTDSMTKKSKSGICIDDGSKRSTETRKARETMRRDQSLPCLLL